MISEAVIKRLPRYYRLIKQLADSGVERVSSNKIAGVLNITASLLCILSKVNSSYWR